MSANHPQDTEELNKWLNGDLTNQEVADSLGKDTLLKFEQILSEVDQWQPSTDSNVHQPDLITSRKKAKQISLKQILSIAASVLLLMVAGYVYTGFSVVTHTTGFGETKEIILPDGVSIATLGPKASIKWNKNDWSDNSRQLSMTGKALFKVNPGSPFTVNTNSGSVEVLGTTFVVNESESSMVVICYEGKVRANRQHTGSKIIKGGQSILFHNEKWEEIKTIKEKLPSWMFNEMQFDDAPIIMVINELKSFYGIKVDFGNVDLQRRYSGSFPTDDLPQALEIVFGTLNINFRLSGNQLTLME